MTPTSGFRCSHQRGAIPQAFDFTTAQFVKAVREHDPTRDMPLIEIADLSPYRFKQEQFTKDYAQCGNTADFGTLLNFSVWMIYFVDFEHDGSSIGRVAEYSVCTPLEFDEFSRTIGGLNAMLKSPPPGFLRNPTYTQAIRIYGGWIDSPRSSYNLRSTIVWQTGDRMVALHSRQSV